MENQAIENTPINKPKNKNKKIILIVTGIVGFVLLLCCACSGALFYFAADSSVKNIQKAYSDTFCGDRNIRDIYNNSSSALRRNITFTDFSKKAETVKNDCDTVKNTNALNLFSNFFFSLNENSGTTELEVRSNAGNYTVKFENIDGSGFEVKELNIR
jgi:hypothetical protein